ncbi:MAG: GTP cyclohydrolase I FolE [Chloroflexi bacterium]|nr:GTP cyclohydrolase I FolE [Chloroflexota bacterium]MDA8189747.1 GTP cyclohydrolase I FolE [Dehalococcoidales bacterium]
MDQEKIQAALHDILVAIGEDPSREGLVGTPRRVSEMYADLFAGVEQDPLEVLSVGFEEGHQEMVVIKDIPFYSMCEHHLLPFFGVVHIGYIPNGRVVGISKLARVVEIFARRPQLQERLTTQIANSIVEGLEPKGVAVVIEAEHMCMIMRGVEKAGSKVMTSANRGVFRSNSITRSEFFSLVLKGKSL